MRVKADVHISPEEVTRIIETRYGLKVHSLTKVRAVYKAKTSHGVYGFKNAEELPDLPFIISCLNCIRKNGFRRMPSFLPSLEGDWLVDDHGETYFMEEWHDLTEVPPDSYPYWIKIAGTLAEFHEASRGIPHGDHNEREYLGRRHQYLRKMLEKLRNWRQSCRDHRQAALLDFALTRAKLAYHLIQDVPERVMPEHAVWCHGGLQHRNIMIDRKRQIWLIDFETLTYMERVADLAQFVQYHGYAYNWPPSAIWRFLSAYEKRASKPLDPDEWKMFFSYLLFPKRLGSRFQRYYGKRSPDQKDWEKCTNTVTKEFLKETFLQQIRPMLERRGF
jgi:CotS family spore coat protein